MNIALIGLGMVASTHSAAIKDAPGLQLTGVLGRDPDRAAVFAQQHSPGARIYTSTAEIAADDSIDFVIIATPPNARSAIITPLIAAAKPVLMEKPIERTLDAATDIVTSFARAKVPLGLVFQHRARAASQRLKALIDAGELGTIVHADLRVPWWRDQSYYDSPGRGSYDRDGGGVMISQAIHTLDLALWLLGPVDQVQALMHRTPLHQLDAEDWAAALLEWPSGAVGSLTATTAAFPGSGESLSIQGTKAGAVLTGGELTMTYLDGRTTTTGRAVETGGGADPMAFTHAWHQAVIEDFAQAVTNNHPPLATGESGLHAHALIDAMERAGKSGQRTKVKAP